MAPRCGCGSSGVCNCLIVAGDNIIVTGSGSTGNPYVITGSGGGGGGSCVTTTLTALLALQTAGTLDTCTTYIVTDWVTPNALPGPNWLFVNAVRPNKLGEDVGVYCSGQVDAVLGSYVGPVRGKYQWVGLLPGMYYLESVLGNKVSDLSGSLLTIDAIPWNTFVLRENVIDGVSFTGGFAVTSALFTSLGASQIANCQIIGGTINLTGATASVLFDNTRMATPSLILAGPSINISSCEFESGAKIDLTGKTAGSLTMRRCSIRQHQPTVGLSAITFDGDADLVLNNVEMLGSNLGYSSDTDATWGNVAMNTSTVFVGSGTRGLALIECSLLSTSVFQNRTGGPTDLDTLSRSSMSAASFSLSGAVDPGMAQLFDAINIDTGSVAVTSPAAVTNPVAVVVCEAAGILNVNAGGAISYVRVAVEATLNTGAFTHDHVIVDGLFTKTATAANTNTLTNKSFDDLI